MNEREKAFRRLRKTPLKNWSTVTPKDVKDALRWADFRIDALEYASRGLWVALHVEEKYCWGPFPSEEDARQWALRGGYKMIIMPLRHVT
jgi:hypothetical protein